MLLLEAAADWWVALLRERSGRRPDDWAEFTMLLAKRFGSSTRVDRARAELRDIRQGQNEAVRAYSTRFEALLGKLPSFDRDWAKTQFIWGLHTRVAELVVIAGPSDLHAAIRKAEEIEMARNVAYGGQSGQRGMQQRGRGRFSFGRGKFNVITPQTSAGGGQPVPSAAATQGNQAGQSSSGNRTNVQCWNCSGYGHFADKCPSAPRQGRGRGRGRWNYRGQ